jgi:hypothetical protein
MSPYSPTTWIEGVTTLGPTNMNHIEQGIASLAAPAPSTTPPASPADGDIWYLPADAPNGVIWQFRYNAGSASAYKWEFVGGSPTRSYVATQESTTNTGSVALTTPGPSLTIPRSGEYSIEVGAFAYNTSIGNAAIIDLYVNGASVSKSVYGGATVFNSVFVRHTPSVITGGWAVALLYHVSGGTGFFGERQLFATPIRVS